MLGLETVSDANKANGLTSELIASFQAFIFIKLSNIRENKNDRKCLSQIKTDYKSMSILI